jgi:hypothetical protein
MVLLWSKVLGAGRKNSDNRNLTVLEPFLDSTQSGQTIVDGPVHSPS